MKSSGRDNPFGSEFRFGSDWCGWLFSVWTGFWIGSEIILNDNGLSYDCAFESLTCDSGG